MIEIIPAIDLIDGKCVRLSQGDFSQRTTYSENPLDVAQRFETAGVKRLHIVDLDGARSGKIANLKVLEKIARSTNLKIDFGGGIRTSEDLKGVFDAGAAMASLGSIAVKEPLRFADFVEYYGDKILLGADVRDGRLSIDGWQTKTDREIVPFLSECRTMGVRQVFVTDISKDGLLEGPSIELYTQIINALPDMKLIASGGVSSIDDITELDNIGCHAVIVGKAIYEGKINLDDLGKTVVDKNARKKNHSLS